MPADGRTAKGAVVHATTADEWFDHFIASLETNPTRRRRAISEQYRPLPRIVLAQRVYDAETVNLLERIHAA